MPNYRFRLYDKNTREEVFTSSDFSLGGIPEIGHRLHDADLVERFGGPAVVNAVLEAPDYDPASDEIRLDVIIDGVEEQLNTGPVTR